jgi:hypothetical protein
MSDTILRTVWRIDHEQWPRHITQVSTVSELAAWCPCWRNEVLCRVYGHPQICVSPTPALNGSVIPERHLR